MRLIRFLATTALSLGGAAIASYAIGWEPLRRWLDPPMAVNTATAIVLLSFGVLLLTLRGDRK